MRLDARRMAAKNSGRLQSGHGRFTFMNCRDAHTLPCISLCLRCSYLWLLVDPVSLGVLVRDDLLWLEPESDLVLGALNTIRTVADVAADILYGD
jgi:hypothetical protein